MYVGGADAVTSRPAWMNWQSFGNAAFDRIRIAHIDHAQFQRNAGANDCIAAHCPDPGGIEGVPKYGRARNVGCDLASTVPAISK